MAASSKAVLPRVDIQRYITRWRPTLVIGGCTTWPPLLTREVPPDILNENRKEDADFGLGIPLSRGAPAPDNDATFVGVSH